MSADPRPVIIAVGDNALDLRSTEQALRDRYAGDYDIIVDPTPDRALERFAEIRAAGRSVAIIFAACRPPDYACLGVLREAHILHPQSVRVGLMPPANRSAAKPLLRAISLGELDWLATIPRRTPDESFHRLVTEILEGWQRQRQAQPTLATLIGNRWDARSHELRGLIARGGLPFAFHESDSPEGRALAAEVGLPDGPFPILVRFDGQVLANPDNEATAKLLGAREVDLGGVFDLAIVGSGPAGLSAAVYGASEGLRTIVLDRETIGGQAGTSALIRNYLGFPIGISGTDLTNRALDQAWSFGAETSVLRDVIALHESGDLRVLTLASGIEITSRAVVLATGARYQRLGISTLEALVGAGVFYGGGITEAPAMHGLDVYVVGAGNSAGQAAINLAKYARQVTMLVRGTTLAVSMSDYLIKVIQATPNIDVRLRTRITAGHGTHRLEALTIEDATGAAETVPASALFVLIGAQPQTDWLPARIARDDRGFLLTEQMLPFETSLPGVFAVGDVRHGSIKRVAAAVGEGGMVIQSVHQYLARLAKSPLSSH